MATHRNRRSSARNRPSSTSAHTGGDSLPEPSLDVDVLQLRLMTYAQTQPKAADEVIDEFCRAVARESQGRLSLHLCEDAAQGTFYPVSGRHAFPLHIADRFYGTLEVAHDANLPGGLPFPLEDGQRFANWCALVNALYSAAFHQVEAASSLSHPITLTSRQQDVLALMCQGFTSAEIARTLGISLHTVRTHREHIYAH